MRLISGKLLTGAILAAYGGISLLGYGLHALVPHAGQHRGMHVVECASHRAEETCGCAFHQRTAERAAADEANRSATAVVQTGDCVGCSHECGICVYLAQARSVPPQVTATAFWQPLVTDIRPACDSIHHEPMSVGPHAPRGPPSVV